MPGTAMPGTMAAPCQPRQVTCPPGTYHATSWRPLHPPRMVLPPCRPFCESDCQSLPEPIGRMIPQTPEEIPLPVGTPMEMEASPPAEDVPGPLEMPDVSDQSVPRDEVVENNAKTPTLDRVAENDVKTPTLDRVAENDAKTPTLDRVAENDAKTPTPDETAEKDALTPAGYEVASSKTEPEKPSPPAPEADVELIDLILAEDIEPWSGRIVSGSVTGK